MAADSPPPPPPPPPPPAPTTITALSDDILREIFLRLPDVTTLARAAFACPAFLHAVRSSPEFRRRFRQLRAPPLIALLMPPAMRAIVPADARKGSGIAADFERLLQDPDSSESEWWSDPEMSFGDGHVDFFNLTNNHTASYKLHSRALNVNSKYFRDGNGALLEFHTLSHDGEEQRPSQVVCVHRDRAWAWASVAVFSAHNMEWQVVLPKMKTRRLLVGYERYATGNARVVNGFVCWVVPVHDTKGCILALNTSTFQFSRMELPPPMKLSIFQLGHTKDGEFCIVSVQQCMLSVWLWATDGDGVKRFMLHKTFSLRANVTEVTQHSEVSDVRMRPMAVINGFVYLTLTIDDHILYRRSPEWFLSFCLETAEVNLLHKDKFVWCIIGPYIMVSWPSSLIHGKDSETRVTGNISEDDGPMCTKETSVLFAALQSFKEKLIDDDNSKFAEIDSFLLDDEMNSLLNRITILESGLAAARDRVLKIGTEPNSMSGMEIVTSESE